jgi:hypothetical protein
LGYFYQKIQQLNKQLMQIHEEENLLVQWALLTSVKSNFLSTINSYLGFLKHTKSFKKRKHLLDQHVLPEFWEYFVCNASYTKVTMNTKKVP